MFLIYTPEDGEPQRFPYAPRKMMSPEMEAIERVTSKNWSQFTQDVLQGNALCRRALLWVLLKRQHPTLKFADVAITWEQLRLEFSKQEYQRMIEEAQANLTGDDLAMAMQKYEAEMADAIDEDGDLQGGKALLPIAD